MSDELFQSDIEHDSAATHVQDSVDGENVFVEAEANPHRPRESFSQSMRYGDMRDQLRKAAEARANRVSGQAPATSDIQAPPSANASEQAEDLESNPDQNLPDYEAPPEYEIDEIQRLEDMNALRIQREQQALANESPFSCLSQPTTEWGKRKFNLILHLVVGAIIMLSDNPEECGIPLNLWLGVYFLFLAAESVVLELRKRLQDSMYWQVRTTLRKVISTSISVAKELGDCSWIIYGATLYWSKNADHCSDVSSSMMFCMLMFILLGLLKILLFGFVGCIVIYILIKRRFKKRNARNQSVQVLRGLQRVKFSSLITEGDPELECIICYNDYGEDDEVTRLDCNEKHMFHTECITNWVKQDKNSCPVCRAPINASIQL